MIETIKVIIHIKIAIDPVIIPVLLNPFLILDRLDIPNDSAVIEPASGKIIESKIVITFTNSIFIIISFKISIENGNEKHKVML